MPLNDNAEGTGSLGFSRITQPNLPEHSAAGHAAPRLSAPINPKRRKALEKKLNLQEILKILYRGRWIILVTFAAVFAYSVYSTYSKPYIFGSYARMLVEKSPVASAKLQLSVQDDDHSIANQIQFFQSRVVGHHVARLIYDLGQGNHEEMDSLFTEYFGSTKAVPPDRNQLSLLRMQDNPKLAAVPGDADLAAIEARVTGAVSIVPEGDNDYLGVSAEAYTPLDAALIVNTYIVVFAKDNLSRSRANSAALKQFLSSQVKRSADTLYQVESQLKNYLKESTGLSVEQRAAELTTQYEQTKLKRDNLAIEVAQSKRIVADLERNLDTVERNFYRNLTLEPYIQILQNELAQSQFDVEQMLATNNAMDPRTKKYFRDDIQAKQERIASLNEKLKEKAQELLHSQVIIATSADDGNGSARTTSGGNSSLAVTKLREAILSNHLKIGQGELVLNELDDLTARQASELGLMPEKVIRAGQLRRSQSSAEKLYSELEDKYMDAWLSEQSVFGSVKIEDPATLSPAPIRPNRKAAIFSGALIGLALGVGIVMLRSFMDSTIRSPEEIEAQGLHVLATIPLIDQLTPENTDASPAPPTGLALPKFTPHRVTHLDSRSSVAESYRSLRTAVQFAGLDHTIKSLVVTSSAPQEGKSTTSSNLAIVMAQTGRKTLLVDTDLRRPVVHSVFGLDRDMGLTNVLFNRASIEEAVQATDIDNLFVLTSGIIPPNPAELIGSERMAEVIEELKTMFDMVIFDTPPVVAVTDALLLGRKVDATLLIARSDTTRTDGLLRAVDQIERSGAKLLGVVLNNFNVANAYGAYYRYYQYYQYYSNDAPKRQLGLRRYLPSFKKKGQEQA